MKNRPLAALLLPGVLAGCVSGAALEADVAAYQDPKAGFIPVFAGSAQATGKRTVWVQSQEEALELRREIKSLVVQKLVGADTAVQVALLNNKGLQAAYANIGIDAADVWQQMLPQNPTVSVGVLGIGAPEMLLFRAIEGMVTTNLQAMYTRERRVELARMKFEQTQLKAVEETLRLAADTRRAWIRAVSANEVVAYLNQGQAAADAASELAKKLGESGAMPKAAQAREHAFYAELTGQLAEARLNAKLAKEELARLMGLWGSELDFSLPNKLPQLPKSLRSGAAIEAEALRNRVDLKIALLELELAAKAFGLTNATRYLTDLELISGVEIEQEVETEYELNGGHLDERKERKLVMTPQLEFEFVIPIFDSGQARLRKAELAYLKAANLVAERAVNVRSEARSAYTSYRARHELARHYKSNVLPLRQSIEEESLLTYNGMITNTFELLADTQAKISTLLLSVSAKRDFWLADADLNAVIFGPGSGASAGSAAAPEMAESGGSPH
ncbi:TolC family protein [Nitratireductor sp. CH_MIT9313-5]|uniref:TolC family protein n=1 Tax=Nitratireductor sp. CH_MIT9313-5 TaxID=3107764 RepID=UPI003008D0AA